MAGINYYISEYGTIIIFAIIIVFTLLTMWYYSKKDIYDPEPPGRLIFGFILGILSVIPAVILSLIGGALVGFNPVLLTVVVAPIMEEIAKLWMVIYLARSDSFDGPLDGLIYGAMVGAGFAAAENVLYGLTALTTSGAFSGVTLTTFRSLTLIVGHPLYTGLAGVGVGEWKVGMTKGKYGKIWRSMLFHGLWNLSASLASFTLVIMGLIIVVSINVYVLRKEMKRTLALDKDAYERGYYGQKQKMLEMKRQKIKNQINQASWNTSTPSSWQPNTVNSASSTGSPNTAGIPMGETQEDTDQIKNQPSNVPNFCKYCGTKRKEGDVFCRNCGTKLVT